MIALHLRPASLDAVVSFYALIHIPLADQQALFPRIRSWLRPGGYLLAITGAQRWTAPSPTTAPACLGPRRHRHLPGLADSSPTRPIWHRYIPEGASGHSLILARTS
jgi:hypothetical protein